MTDQNEQSVCAARHLNHVCIAVRDIDETLRFYRDVFGTDCSEVEEIADQSVKAALVTVGGSQLEFIQPTDVDGSAARFIERRGEGLHHVCFEVEDLQAKLDLLAARGIDLIDSTPRQGLSGMIAFLHPRSTCGVLVELVDSDTVRG